MAWLYRSARMFERFVRLAQARKALKTGQFDQAIQHLGDPLVRRHRRAEEIRAQALAGLLMRAKKRAGAGGLSAAISDIDAVLATQPEFDGAQSLRAELLGQIESDEERVKEARKLLKEARLMAEGGDLEAALTICGAADRARALPVEEDGLRKLIEGRRVSAQDFFSQAEQAASEGDIEVAQNHLCRARAIDRGLKGLDKLAKTLASQLGEALVKEMRRVSRSQGGASALVLEAKRRAGLPELAHVSKLQSYVAELALIEAKRIVEHLKNGELEAGIAAYRALDPAIQRSASLAQLGEAVTTLQAALDLEASGNFRLAEQNFQEVADSLSVGNLRKQVSRMASQAEVTERLLEKARKLAAEGQLVGAKEALLELLQKWPGHESARREMDLLDQGAVDKEQRLSQARDLAKTGHLRQASAICLTLAVPGPYGDESRLLLKDLQARMDLVRSGMQQVLGAIHNRGACTLDGLSHCLGRLGELRRIQVDDEELESLADAIEAEIKGLEILTEALDSLESDKAAVVAELAAQVVALQPKLVSADRLTSRSQDLVGRSLLRAGQDLASGRLRSVRSWLSAAGLLAGDTRSIVDQIEVLNCQLSLRQERAEELAAAGRSAMNKRELENAEGLLGRARAEWLDGPEVLRLEGELRKLRGQVEEVSDVEALASGADYDAARRKLGKMGPTENLLRTRIYDLKKNLAKAQGLETAFLLRVDEGGEFVVMRGESLTVGNVRDDTCDLPILANLAGRHARVTRSMSFHGGMQDRILSERGPIAVRGREVSEHRLKSGDRVALGTALELEYRIPSKRSLTASLSIRGGFQVCGTDRILLMKDRGRDGRILIGSAKDSHARVPNAEGEVEIFASKDGQVRVRYEGQGEMDGRPFSGEHPITAGATVVCGNITFVLQPWSRADAQGS